MTTPTSAARGSGRGARTMRGAVLHAPRDVRYDEIPMPRIEKPTDAVIRVAVACVCGSDLWPYRGANPVTGPRAMGHEYCGVVEGVGSAVRNVQPGQFVVGSFVASDDTCAICREGYHSSCLHGEAVSGSQAPFLRVPLADGTLVPTPSAPPDDLLPSLLTLSDVMGTGWFAAEAAHVRPGATAVVVGDGAVGLLAVLSAKRKGASRILAMSGHEASQRLARAFGATEIVEERGEEGIARVMDLTDGVGADCVMECVGTAEAMEQAIGATRPGGHLGYVGVPHGVQLDGQDLFFRHVNMLGGPAPVRAYLPHLIDLVWRREIEPGKVFDVELPLERVADAYRAMDERRAIKVLLRP